MVLGAGRSDCSRRRCSAPAGSGPSWSSREDPADRRAQVVRELGAEYVSTPNCTLADVAKRTGAPDIVVEATGNAGVAFDAMRILGPQRRAVPAERDRRRDVTPEPIDLINRRLVMGNQVVFGSVNANPRHFVMGIKDFARIEKKYPGVLRKLLTHPIPWERLRQLVH